MRAKLYAHGKRDAVRILFLIAKAGGPVKRGAPEGTCLVVSAEKKIQALDFWMRNPDYLAWEILDQYEAGRCREGLLQSAGEVMDGDEPDIRRLPMQRFLFGAWEALDDAVATLRLHGLVDMKRQYNTDGTKILQTNYFLTDVGARKVEALSAVAPLDWYATRGALVAEVAGDRTGNQLKQCQYRVAAYNHARHGTIIAPIRDAVLNRLTRLMDAA